MWYPNLRTAYILIYILTSSTTFALPPTPVNLLYPDPNDDPFYSQPANIGRYRNGEVIDSRRVPTIIVTTILGRSVQIKYKTTDGQNQNVSTIATLWSPLIPHKPPALLSYQLAEDSLNLDCAPSWAWIPLSGSYNFPLAAIEGPQVIPWALAKGYYVVQPDALGPRSTWLVGKMEGQATLDGIRAATNYLKLASDKVSVALYGYSGGAFSTISAASLAKIYAPEIKIVGAAYGGTPLDQNATNAGLNKSPQALLVGGSLFGQSAGYPDLEASFQSGPYSLTAAGKKAQQKLRSRNYVLNLNQQAWAGTDWNTYFNMPLDQNPTLRRVWAVESLLQTVNPQPVPVPLFPRYQYHSQDDETIPYYTETQYVKEQCGQGANIKFDTFKGTSHVETALEGLPRARDFISKAFSGTLPKCNCGTVECS